MTGATGPPDPHRLGGLAWTQRTNGALTARERRRLLAEVVRGQASYLAGRFWLATGRVPDGAATLTTTDLSPPDSRFARTAEEACREQPPGLVGHGYRTWVYGSGLAALDRHSLDPELFYVSSLLHDHGLIHAVAGEDFTLRSARRAQRCAHDADAPAASSDQVADAITAHITPGIRPERDGPLGVYVQAGATLDLLGLRAGDLPRVVRDGAVAHFPRDGLVPEVTTLVAAEARAVPNGRLGLLHGCGFNILVRHNPLRER